MTIGLKRLLLLFLGLSYLSVLALSTAHLTNWFSLTAGELPGWLSLGLAVGWEFLAFSLSLASTLEPRLRWTFYGALFVMSTVWFGNFIAMLYAAQGLPLWMVLIQSSFALGPMIAGKAIGELLRLRETPRADKNAAIVTREPAPVPAVQAGAVAAQVVRVETHVHSVPHNGATSEAIGELGSEETRVLTLIQRGQGNVSQLIGATGFSPKAVVGVCGLLEGKGLIRAAGTGWEAVN